MKKALFFAIAAGILSAGTAMAEFVAVENFSFEQPGVGKVSGWNGKNGTDVPGWTGKPDSDNSGIEDPRSNEGRFKGTDGQYSGLLGCVDAGVWNLTTRTTAAGEVFILKVDASNGYTSDRNSPLLKMTLYYNNAGSRVPIASQTFTLPANNADIQWVEYTIAVSADSVPMSLGKKIGIELENATTSTTSSWLIVDNVRLSVVASGGGDNYYVNQSGSGKEDGSSYENAMSLSNFSNGNLEDLDGDTVFFSGDFTGTLIPPDSGSMSAPVILDGNDNVHPPAVFRRGVRMEIPEPKEFARYLCLYLFEKNHITLRNFRFEGQLDAKRSAWAYVDECSHIRFESIVCTKHGRIWEPWGIWDSSYLTHVKCSWNGSDQQTDYECDGINIKKVHHSRWLDCYFGSFPHNSLEAKGGGLDDYNIFRGCTFENKWRTGLNASFYTKNAWWLVENNTFKNCGYEPDTNPCVTWYNIDSGGPGFQSGSPNHIVRKNVFRDNNTGITAGWAHGDQTDCNIYQNTFYNNHRMEKAGDWTDGHISGTPCGHDWLRNIIWNNIFSESRVRQIVIDRDGEIQFESIRNGIPGINSNVFWDSSANEIRAQYRTGGYTNPSSSKWIVASQGSQHLEDEYAKEWANNRVADPRFLDPENNKFKLAADSPAIDAGRFLTAITSGTGLASSFTVMDASFFFDGWDMPDEIGDVVKTENGQMTTIQSIDYDTNTITVSPAINVVNGEGIALKYTGSAPDSGAFEYVFGGPPDDKTPSIPRLLRAMPVSSSRIDLSWNPSTDNVEVTRYRIYRDGSYLTTIADTSYQDTGLQLGDTYTYAVCAYDATGNGSDRSISATATTWSLMYVDSEETSPDAGEDGAAVNSFDGDPGTIWNTKWHNIDPNPPHPHEIQIDMGDSYDLIGFRYLPRQDDGPGGENGMVGEYEFYVSNDGTNWNKVTSGDFVKDKTEKTVRFNATVGRYIRLRALSEVNGNPWTSMAELRVISQLGTNQE